MKSLLEEKSQSVNIGTEASELNFVNHGVPQGSVIVPLLFPLYDNDFQKKIRGDFELVQFAEDTSILCQYEPGKRIAKN